MFTIYLGPEKVVVLAGYKTVKEALINNADTFGERQAPLIIQEVTQDNGTEKKNQQKLFVCVTFRKRALLNAVILI